ncbi:hypothetical protein PPGU19_101220 (plasmid) [Paraburkholderia sp. PGU19]|uniref:hypothetical protein n=1 Tax=Paraburkholderia sp. PGU19 TaxID=2735434 RepID=UPI0015D9E5A5|nr:hypothetical protein [Paraburkholderia sp. PGU19]BCG05554.1 hypothetical protein PPGU19_101220 [Paraburkholderia sp. PGU19]
MKLRTVASCLSIALALAMPFTVLSMTRALFDDGTARTTLGNRQDEVRRLAELDGDIRSIEPSQALTVLSRHSLSGTGELTNRLAVARGDLAIARAEYVASAARLKRAMVIGFLCVAATSWAAVSLATVWPRGRRSAAVTT